MERVFHPSPKGATEPTRATNWNTKRAFNAAGAVAFLALSAGSVVAGGTLPGQTLSDVAGTMIVRMQTAPVPETTPGMMQVAFAASNGLLFDPAQITMASLTDDAVASVPDSKPTTESRKADAVTAAIAPAQRSLPDTVLLGSAGNSVALTPITTRWNRVVGKADTSAVTLQSCVDDRNNCPNDDIRQWAEIVRKGQSLRQGHRIAYVNTAINRLLTYREDIQLWRRAEFWATPLESLDKGAGDCEDFAILKYWSLRMLGFEDRDMRVTVLRDSATRLYHAVLAVNFGKDWLILDNRFSRVRLQRDLPNYRPLYSVNRTGQWAHAPNKKRPVRLAARLKQIGLQ